MTPGNPQPANTLLGQMLLEMDRPGEALEAFEAQLELWPRHFNSIWGAARAAAASGDGVRAVAHYSSLMELTGEESGDRPALGEARAYLASD